MDCKRVSLKIFTFNVLNEKFLTVFGSNFYLLKPFKNALLNSLKTDRKKRLV